MNCTGGNFIVVPWFITEQKSDDVCATHSVGRQLWQNFESTKSMRENIRQQQALRLAISLLSEYRDAGSNT